MKIPEIIEQNKKAVLLVDVRIPKEGNQVNINIKGTGFIISEDGKFVTNAHVYRQIQESEMEYAGVSVPGMTDEKGLTHYDRFKMEKIDIDDENDIAVLKIVSDKKFETVQGMGNSEIVKEGEDAVYIGYPLAPELLNMGFGITMTTNKCIISSVKRNMNGALHFFLIDTHANNGSSGSPLFNQDGQAIGVVSAKIISARVPGPDGKMIDIPANMGICRPIKYAIDLINKNK